MDTGLQQAQKQASSMKPSGASRRDLSHRPVSGYREEHTIRNRESMLANELPFAVEEMVGRKKNERKYRELHPEEIESAGQDAATHILNKNFRDDKGRLIENLRGYISVCLKNSLDLKLVRKYDTLSIGEFQHECHRPLGVADPRQKLREFRMERLLGKLSPEERRLIELRFFHGLPFSKIGEEMGISENTCCQRNHRILNKLRGIATDSGLSATSFE